MPNANAGNDARLDLVLERIIKVPRHIVWKAWTEPEHLKKWFTPAPWRTIDCDIDLRPGGVFRNVMKGPEGPAKTYTGCYLEIVDQERIVWTLALGPGFRPMENDFLVFTAIITMEDHKEGTKYTAQVMHRTDAERQKHADLGFEHGWGAALDQLVAVADQIK